MDHGLTNDTRFDQQMLQQMKCCVCMELYEDPTSLPCGHTFCFKCLVDIAQHKKRAARNPYIVMEMTIPCPNCRFPVPYPDLMTKSNGVVTNFVLMSVFETLMQQRETCTKVDAATNTDTAAYSEQHIKRIASDLDAIFSSVRQKGSILQDCRDEIDVIRKDYENNLLIQSSHNSSINESHLIDTTELNPAAQTASRFTSHIPFDVGDLDPAILLVASSLPTVSVFSLQTLPTDTVNVNERYIGNI